MLYSTNLDVCKLCEERFVEKRRLTTLDGLLNIIT